MDKSGTILSALPVHKSLQFDNLLLLSSRNQLVIATVRAGVKTQQSSRLGDGHLHVTIHVLVRKRFARFTVVAHCYGVQEEGCTRV